MHTGQNHFSKPWLMQTDESSDNLWTESGAYLTASNLIVRKKPRLRSALVRTLQYCLL